LWHGTSLLHSIEQSTQACTEQQQNLIQQGCSCGNVDGNAGNNDTPAPNDDPKITTPCQLCSEDTAATNATATLAFPDKQIGYLLGDVSLGGDIPLTGTAVENITCSTLQILLQQTANTQDKICTDARFLLQSICDCPLPYATNQQMCNFCGNVSTLPDPQRMVYSVQQFGFPPVKCQDIQLFLNRGTFASDHFCVGGRDIEYLCDCADGRGIDFREQQSWIVRLAGCLSFVGSCYILLDVCFRIRQIKVFCNVCTRRIGKR
jgi:hypothetical protein